MRILNYLKGEKKMTVEPMYLKAGNKIFSGEYRDTETRDTFDMKEEELIRNEVINVLAKHNVPFRQAHKIVGEIVSYCENKNIAIDDMSLDEFHNFSKVFGDDILSEITIENCVNKRNSFGGTSIKNVEMQIENGKKFLQAL